MHMDQDVLEYGCGGGSDAMSWLRRGNRVTYADVVPFNVETAGQRITAAGLRDRAMSLLLADSAPIPLDDAHYDVISSHGVLHHIASEEMRDKVMGEFYRVMRPGGTLYVMLYTEHLRDRLDVKVTNLMMFKGLREEEAFCWLTDEPGCPYAIPYTEEQGWAYIEKAGFKRVTSMLYNNNDFRTFIAVKP